MSALSDQETRDLEAFEEYLVLCSTDRIYSDGLAFNWRECLRQERKKRWEMKWKEKIKELEADRLRSRPEEQFHDEVEDEETWLNQRIGKRDGNYFLARKRIIKRWIDQGIWRNEFRFSGPSKWKHEDPTSVEPKCEYEDDGIAFSLPREETKSTEMEELEGAEMDERQEREREASRPVYRFFYQMMVEYKKLLEFAASLHLKLDLSPKDPSEDAEEALEAYYQVVGPEIKKKRYQEMRLTDEVSHDLRCKWDERGIWDKEWKDGMPDLLWKHERSIEQCICQASEACHEEYPELRSP